MRIVFALILLGIVGCDGYGNSSTTNEYNQEVRCSVECAISVDSGVVTATESCEGIIEPGDQVAEGVCSSFVENVPREEEFFVTLN